MMQKDNFAKRFGYDNRTLKCNFIANSSDYIWDDPKMFFIFEAAVPAFLILVCYACILFQVYGRRTLKALNETGLVAQIFVKLAVTTLRETGLVPSILFLASCKNTSSNRVSCIDSRY